MKKLVSITLLLLTVSASANLTCPANAELFDPAQVREVSGYITFRN